MSTNRRTFLKLSALAGGAVGLGGLSPSAALGLPLYRGLPDVEQAPRSKRILILGACSQGSGRRDLSRSSCTDRSTSIHAAVPGAITSKCPSAGTWMKRESSPTARARSM